MMQKQNYILSASDLIDPEKLRFSAPSALNEAAQCSSLSLKKRLWCSDRNMFPVQSISCSAMLRL